MVIAVELVVSSNSNSSGVELFFFPSLSVGVSLITVLAVISIVIQLYMQ